MDEIKPGQIYSHFKGGKYKIIAIARDCENPKQKYIIYEQLHPSEKFPIGTIWKREISNFLSFKILPDETKIKRFTLIE